MRIKSKLNMDQWDVIEKDLKYLESFVVESGIVDEIIHPETDGLTVAEVALYNDTGVKNKNGSGWKIPPRPFMLDSFMLAQFELDKWNDRLMYEVGLNKTTNTKGIQKGLDYLSKEYADLIIKTVDTQNYVDNAISTKKRKGHDTILLDSGVMLRNIKGKVSKKITGGES